MSDGSSREEQPGGGGGGAVRVLGALAVGAAVAVAVVAGQKLLERRHGGDGDGGPGAGAKRASAKDATTDAAERPADLATELRSAQASSP